MSSDVAETTSLLTNSPMENGEVSASAVIDGTANFILGFSNSSMRNFFSSSNLSFCMHNPLPEEKEIILEVEGLDKMIQVGEIATAQAQTITVTEIEISVTDTSQETIMGIENLLEIEAKIMAILVETKEVEAEVEVDLIQVSMSED